MSKLKREGLAKKIRDRNRGLPLINTQHISLCKSCNCATLILMDVDGNRFCGKCKKPKEKS